MVLAEEYLEIEFYLKENFSKKIFFQIKFYLCLFFSSVPTFRSGLNPLNFGTGSASLGMLK